MTELICGQFTSSSGNKGRYFGSVTGITLFSGPPIDAFRFALEKDDPRWRTLIPG